MQNEQTRCIRQVSRCRASTSGSWLRSLSGTFSMSLASQANSPGSRKSFRIQVTLSVQKSSWQTNSLKSAAEYPHVRWFNCALRLFCTEEFQSTIATFQGYWILRGIHEHGPAWGPAPARSIPTAPERLLGVSGCLYSRHSSF